MAKRKIPPDDLAFGRAVLLATDALKMSAEGAFWIRYSGESRWRYFIVTSLFDSGGSNRGYDVSDHMPAWIRLPVPDA